MNAIARPARVIGLAVAACIFIMCEGCEKETVSPETNNPSAMVSGTPGIESSARATTTNTHTTSCFSAIAQVTACAGEWIRFSGEITTTESRVTDGTGRTHISRSFTVNNLTGVGVTPGSTLSAMTCGGTLQNGSLTGTSYTVAGGAEMFNIHFDEGGSATLGGSHTFLHRGTLVFVSNETGERLVAIHIIRKVNGIVQENTWECH